MNYEIGHFPGREIVKDGKTYLYFGGTSYLGMGINVEFLSIFKSFLDQYGAFYGASRIGNVKLDIYRKAEEFLAKWAGSESALLASSGYLAGQLCITSFTEDHHLLVAPDCHSSLWPAGAREFDDFANLKNYLYQVLKEGSKIPVIFTDTVGQHGGETELIKELEALPLSECVLVADDSHGIGLLGKEGSGHYREMAELNPRELILCTSLGKAFGIGAGAIFSSENQIKKLRANPMFAGASPASPSAIAAFLKAQPLYDKARKKLQENLKIFYTQIAGNPFIKGKANLPYAVCISADLIEFLEKKGIIISSFKYIAEKNTPPGRIVLSASHTQEDILYLTQMLAQFTK